MIQPRVKYAIHQSLVLTDVHLIQLYSHLCVVIKERVYGKCVMHCFNFLLLISKLNYMYVWLLVQTSRIMCFCFLFLFILILQDGKTKYVITIFTHCI